MKNNNFGKTIYKLRKKHGLTQSELAAQLNVSDKAVSKWENGAGYPEITQLPALAEIFSVSIDCLLKGNPNGIVVAGNILTDIVNIIDKYPDKNMLTHISKSTRSVGGCVTNTIIDLARIDSQLYLSAIGKIGDDEYGRYVTSEMKKYGIDTSRVKISSELPTSFSSVMTEEKSGERTFFCLKGATSDFSEDDIELSTLDCEIFHIGYILLLDSLDKGDDEYGTKMARLLHHVQQRGIKTSIDAVSSEQGLFAEKIIPALKYCNYVIMNEIECCNVTGANPRRADGSVNVEAIRKTMEKFIEYGVSDKVIIHCCEGGFALGADGTFTAVASLELPEGYIKGSVGAGDAFAAACLYALYNAYDDVHMLEFASAAAAMNLSAPDSVSGMRSKEEIEELNRRFKRRKSI